MDNLICAGCGELTSKIEEERGFTDCCGCAVVSEEEYKSICNGDVCPKCLEEMGDEGLCPVCNYPEEEPEWTEEFEEGWEGPPEY